MKSICPPPAAFCLLPTAVIGGTCGTNGNQESGGRRVGAGARTGAIVCWIVNCGLPIAQTCRGELRVTRVSAASPQLQVPNSGSLNTEHEPRTSTLCYNTVPL
jgi:hypothetical protein